MALKAWCSGCMTPYLDHTPVAFTTSQLAHFYYFHCFKTISGLKTKEPKQLQALGKSVHNLQSVAYRWEQKKKKKSNVFLFKDLDTWKQPLLKFIMEPAMPF